MSSYTDKEIMDLIKERGFLRFSTLMRIYRISSVEALAIVDRYNKAGIIDEKGKYTKKEVTWKDTAARSIPKATTKDPVEEKQEEAIVPETPVKKERKRTIRKESISSKKEPIIAKTTTVAKTEKQNVSEKPVQKKPTRKTSVKKEPTSTQRKTSSRVSKTIEKEPGKKKVGKDDIEGQMDLFSFFKQN